MAQSWRTLGGVAAGAMVAGWLVVRLLGSRPESVVVQQPTGKAPDLSPLAAASPRERARETEAAPRAEPEPADADAEQVVRERDLLALEDALLRDHRVRDVVLSYPGISEMPSALPYRRVTEFWQPAYTTAARGHR